MIVFVTEPDDIEGEALALLRERGSEVLTAASDAEARAGEVEALFVRTYTRVDEAMLARFPAVRYVLRAGVGLDNVDVEACKRRGVEVINSPGANANAVAEYAVGAIIALLRKVAQQEALLRAGGWRKKELMGTELRGKMLGLVGCGNVAQALVRKLASWELAGVLGYDPYVPAEQLRTAGITPATLDEVIAGADIVSLHVPLIPQTKHLINAAALGRMKPGSILINAARGGVVDEAALVQALKAGTLAGAALDVFETEPAVPEELRTLDTVLLTPHIAGYTHEANKEVSLAPVREFLRRIGA